VLPSGIEAKLTQRFRSTLMVALQTVEDST